MKNRRLLWILIIVSLLLCVPLIAMQFTREVAWSPMDFAIAAILLLGAGGLCEVVLRRFTSTGHRLILCALVLLALGVLWAELAVGVFGTVFAGS